MSCQNGLFFRVLAHCGTDSDKIICFVISDNRTKFTQGGVNVVSIDENSTPDEIRNNQDRIGWVGWAGLGGSVFQVGILFENTYR